MPHDDFVVLDANDGPGGAWRHRWPSLTLDGVHGIHPLPGLDLEQRDDDDARVVVLAITEAGWKALGGAMPRVFAAEMELWRDHRRGDLRDLVALLAPLVE